MEKTFDDIYSDDPCKIRLSFSEFEDVADAFLTVHSWFRERDYVLFIEQEGQRYGSSTSVFQVAHIEDLLIKHPRWFYLDYLLGRFMEEGTGTLKIFGKEYTDIVKNTVDALNAEPIVGPAGGLIDLNVEMTPENWQTGRVKISSIDEVESSYISSRFLEFAETAEDAHEQTEEILKNASEESGIWASISYYRLNYGFLGLVFPEQYQDKELFISFNGPSFTITRAEVVSLPSNPNHKGLIIDAAVYKILEDGVEIAGKRWSWYVCKTEATRDVRDFIHTDCDEYFERYK